MSYAPRILRVSKAFGFCPELPCALSSSYRLFIAVQDGWFQERRWRAGEVLVCEPQNEAATLWSGPVVLEARGLGRPRVGFMEGGRLMGDAGEPCSTARWRVAGRLVGILRPARTGEQVFPSPLTPEGWVLESVEKCNTETVAQLSLFNRAA